MASANSEAPFTLEHFPSLSTIPLPHFSTVSLLSSQNKLYAFDKVYKISVVIAVAAAATTTKRTDLWLIVSVEEE